MTRQTSDLTSEAILTTLARHRDGLRALGVCTLGLFGSFRRGDACAESDVDFLLTLDCPTPRGYMAVTHLLEELFGRPVDLVMAETIKPRIRERILAEVAYAEGLSLSV